MEHFIESVRKYPCVWDIEANVYKDNELKGKAWDLIAAEHGMLNGNVAKKEWKKLRDRLREAVKRQKTTTGQERTNIKPWRYQKQMEFVVPQMRNRTRVSNLEESDEEEHVDSPIETTSSTQGEAAEQDHQENREEIEETIGPHRTRHKSSQHERTGIINFLKQQQQTRETRQKERNEKRKMIEKNDDPLLDFFQSMYKSTKALPWSSQLKIKRHVFNSVLGEEERFVASKENNRSAYSSSDNQLQSSHAGPSHSSTPPTYTYYQNTPTPQNFESQAQGAEGRHFINQWPARIETNQQNEGANGESNWRG